MFFQHLFLIDLIQSMRVFSTPHKGPSVYSVHPYCMVAPHQTLCQAQRMQNQLRTVPHPCRTCSLICCLSNSLIRLFCPSCLFPPHPQFQLSSVICLLISSMMLPPFLLRDGIGEPPSLTSLTMALRSGGSQGRAGREIHSDRKTEVQQEFCLPIRKESRSFMEMGSPMDSISVTLYG